MKGAISLVVLSLAVMLGLSMAAFAQDTITLTGVNGSNYDGVYTGLHSGTLATPTGTTTNAPSVFDDYLLDAPPPGSAGTTTAITDVVRDYNSISSDGPDQGPSLGPTPPPIPSAPEPLSMALLGTFLTLAGFVLGKRKLFT